MGPLDRVERGRGRLALPLLIYGGRFFQQNRISSMIILLFSDRDGWVQCIEIVLALHRK